MSIRFYLFVALSISFLTLLNGCSSKSKVTMSNIEVDLEDVVVQQIFNLRAKRNSDGKADTEALKTYLAVENPNHRYVAALALASIQDSSAIEALGKALKDPYVKVRQAAAFALGQTKHPKAAVVMADYFRQDSTREVLAEILQAVGRSGTANELKHLCTSRPYAMQDSLLLEGLALGLYRFATRNMVQPEGTNRIMNDYIGNTLMPDKARFVAANYLARVPNLDLSRYENVLINNVQEEKKPEILMFMVLCLAKAKTPKAYQALRKCFQETKDYRVRVNILRGIHHFDYDSTRALIQGALYDTSIQVRNAASEVFYEYGKEKDGIKYYEWAEGHPNWFVRTELLAAALRHLAPYKGQSKAFISTKLIDRFQESNNIYEKAAILDALGNFAWNYKFIAEQALPLADSIEVSPVIKSAAATALVKIYGSSVLEQELRLSTTQVKDEIHAYFRSLLEEADAGATAIIAEAIANPKLGLKQVFNNYSFLQQILKKLKLPKEIETYIYVQKAIDYLAGTKTDVSRIGKSNFVEIDWPLINTLGDKPKVQIKTNKGIITLELLPKEAPATVMQFIQLVKADFYNGKAFHRVVPNFVAQAGCRRGDGWGGFDINVVSELSQRRYINAGQVGMASAGKDTESTQFFITHAPAIHLDGNYTIFAKVIEGMDVVHQLNVGDVMESVVIK